MSYDYAILLEDGILIAHQATCPDVDKARQAELPILSMFGCQKPIGHAYKRHACLANEEVAPHPRPNNFMQTNVEDYFPPDE